MKTGKPKLVTYLGGAKDGGEERELYELWGLKFPKGKAVPVTRLELAAKAQSLGCFSVEDEAAEPSTDEKPKKSKKKSE